MNIDKQIENADWIKQEWDLPIYKSEYFSELLKSVNMTFEDFKKLPVYKMKYSNR